MEGIVSPKKLKQEITDNYQLQRNQNDNQYSPQLQNTIIEVGGDKQYNISEESKINSSIP